VNCVNKIKTRLKHLQVNIKEFHVQLVNHWTKLSLNNLAFYLVSVLYLNLMTVILADIMWLISLLQHSGYLRTNIGIWWFTTKHQLTKIHYEKYNKGIEKSRKKSTLWPKNAYKLSNLIVWSLSWLCISF